MAAGELSITEVVEMQAFIGRIQRISDSLRKVALEHGMVVLKKDDAIAVADLLVSCMESVKLQLQFVKTMMEAELKESGR